MMKNAILIIAILVMSTLIAVELSAQKVTRVARLSSCDHPESIPCCAEPNLSGYISTGHPAPVNFEAHMFADVMDVGTCKAGEDTLPKCGTPSDSTLYADYIQMRKDCVRLTHEEDFCYCNTEKVGLILNEIEAAVIP